MSDKDMVWMQEQCFIERSRQIQKGKLKSKPIDRQSIKRSADRFMSAEVNCINKTVPVNTWKVCTKRAGYLLQSKTFNEKILGNSGVFKGIVSIMLFFFTSVRILGNGV